ncbi:MAG: tRNA1(Val) (adenine(37)-N6)-methyltransferase [Firmicutes bacterium]|nr:tRNA1(Val) (adenine(37)-N6)-methyltransferase [Bacillota bacterium]
MRMAEDIGFGNIKLYQDDDGFRYGIDAVILADFANSIKPSAKSIVDLGTGNGAIPFILSHKNKKCHITGIDVQEKAIELANKSREDNGLEDRLTFINKDILDIQDLYGSADVVVSNPPYVAKGSGIINDKSGKFIARQETTAEFRDFAKAAARLLGDKGDFFIVHRPSRLTDIILSCAEFRLEPKTIRFVVPKKGKEPNIVLIHCRLGGGRELKYLPELCVYNEDGTYSTEIETIYER